MVTLFNEVHMYTVYYDTINNVGVSHINLGPPSSFAQTLSLWADKPDYDRLAKVSPRLDQSTTVIP